MRRDDAKVILAAVAPQIVALEKKLLAEIAALGKQLAKLERRVGVVEDAGTGAGGDDD